MDNKIVAVIIIVLLIIIGAAYVLGTQNSNTPDINVNNSSNTTQDINKAIHDSTKHKNDTKQNTTPTNLKISAAQAQQIAIGAAQELGGENDTAGTPTLFKWTGKTKHTWVWDVPLYDAVTKKSAGSMDVDAMTGEVIMNE
ncbi:MAG TPA: hypothetical protein VK426_08930 [Methanobacterium sp.]|nr:hypothetical protein [Methanobacterium sp.]